MHPLLSYWLPGPRLILTFWQVRLSCALLDLLPFIFTDYPCVASLIAHMMEAVQTSEMLANSYESAQCYNLVDSNLHFFCTLKLQFINASVVILIIVAKKESSFNFIMLL
jgi:hypothetical protein